MNKKYILVIGVVLVLAGLYPLASLQLKSYHAKTKIFLSDQLVPSKSNQIVEQLKKINSEVSVQDWLDWISFIKKQTIYKEDQRTLKEYTKTELLDFVPEYMGEFSKISASLEAYDFQDIEDWLDKDYKNRISLLDYLDCITITQAVTWLVYVTKLKNPKFNSSSIIKTTASFNILLQKISPQLRTNLMLTRSNEHLVSLIHHLYMDRLLTKEELESSKDLLNEYLEETDSFNDIVSNEMKSMTLNYKQLKKNHRLQYTFANLYEGNIIASYRSYMKYIVDNNIKPDGNADKILALPFVAQVGIPNLRVAYTKVSTDSLRVNLLLCELDKKHEENGKFKIELTGDLRQCSSEVSTGIGDKMESFTLKKLDS